MLNRSESARAARRQKLKAALKVQHPDSRSASCQALLPPPAWKCGKPTMKAAGKGLSRRFCLAHFTQHRRHGSADRKSFSAAELKPYLCAADRWLKGRCGGDGPVLAAIGELQSFIGYVLGGARAAKGADEMYRAGPKRRAENVLRRMCLLEELPGRRLFAICIATRALCTDDWSGGADQEHFRLVQIGKQVNRIAPTMRPSWGRGERRAEGPVIDQAMRRLEDIDDSEGPFLAVIGRLVERHAGKVAEAALEEVLAIKRERWGEHPSHPPLSSHNGSLTLGDSSHTEHHRVCEEIAPSGPTTRHHRPPVAPCGSLEGLERGLRGLPQAVGDEGITSPSLTPEPPLQARHPAPLAPPSTPGIRVSSPQVATIGPRWSPKAPLGDGTEQPQDARGEGSNHHHPPPKGLPLSPPLSPHEAPAVLGPTTLDQELGMEGASGSPFWGGSSDRAVHRRDEGGEGRHHPVPSTAGPTSRSLEASPHAPASTPDRHHDQWLTLKPSSPGHQLATGLEALLRLRTLLPPSPRKDAAQRQHQALLNLLANLIARPCSPIALALGNLKQTRYDRRVFNDLPRLAAGLQELGAITITPAAFKVRRTAIAATATLRSAMAAYGASLADTARADGEETIILLARGQGRDPTDLRKPAPKALIDYPKALDQDPTLRRFRAELAEINAHLASHTITLAGEPQAAFTLTRRFILRSPADAHRFDLHGRLYGGWWQSLERSQRGLLRIDGEEIADLDYSAMLPRLAYAKVGCEPPEGDLYAVPGLEGHRQGAKKALNALLARSTDLKSLRGELKSLLPAGSTAAQVKAAFATRHPRLVPLFGTDVGVELMMIESTILVSVLLILAHEFGIVALPMHDGLMVQQPARRIAAAVMNKATERTVGIKVPVMEKLIAIPSDNGPVERLVGLSR